MPTIAHSRYKTISFAAHSSYRHCSRHQFYLVNLHNTINFSHKPKAGEETDCTWKEKKRKLFPIS